MTNYKLSNIPLKKFSKFLKSEGLNIIKTTKGRGGHDKWSRSDLDRPIIIQNHITPVPEFIVKQVIRHLGITRKYLVETINNL